MSSVWTKQSQTCKVSQQFLTRNLNHFSPMWNLSFPTLLLYIQLEIRAKARKLEGNIWEGKSATDNMKHSADIRRDQHGALERCRGEWVTQNKWGMKKTSRTYYHVTELEMQFIFENTLKGDLLFPEAVCYLTLSSPNAYELLVREAPEINATTQALVVSFGGPLDLDDKTLSLNHNCH